MITTRKLRQFRDSIVASGIPLLTILQENRESLDLEFAPDGALASALPGRLTGLHVSANHQSGSAFCSTTNATPAGLAGLADVIASAVRRGETPPDSAAFTDQQEKLGKEVEVRDRDLDALRRLAELARGRYRLRARVSDRYLETLSVDAALRNDRQRFLHVAAERDLGEARIEESFVVRRAADAEPAFRRLDERVRLREAWLAAPKAALGSGPRPVLFTPYAASQILLLLLAPSLVSNQAASPDPEKCVGLHIGGERFSVVDDPTRPFLAGSFRVDEEGNPGVAKRLVDRGVVISVVTGAVDALRAGLVPGPCRSAGFEEPPRPAFSNLFVEPHDELDAREMLARLGPGTLVVQTVARPFLADAFGAFRVTLEAAAVAGDDLALHAVADVSLKGTLRDFFAQAAWVGNDVETLSGFLPQPDGRRLPQACGSPSIGFEALHVDAH